MKSKILILLLLLNITLVFSQREAAIWYFGQYAGLDFNSGIPVPLTGSLNTIEGCASISDVQGKLLFYTDGSTVWNANNTIMQNGTGLLGHTSSTQSAIIVPNPNIPSIYYIFTVDQPDEKNADDTTINDTDDGSIDGLNYSEVNMNLNGGLGGINPLKKNVHLITYNQNHSNEVAFKCSEKITAIQHADGNSFWVITNFTNRFYAFRVDYNGVNSTPVISSTPTDIQTGGYLRNAIGYLKSSPNGKKLAIAHYSSRKNNERTPKTNLLVWNTGKVLLYDFDNATGKVSNENLLIGGVNPYGIEFSSKSKKLYVTDNHFDSSSKLIGSSLYQFDLTANNIATSKVLIVKNDNSAGALQLAIDSKIYRAGYPYGGSSDHLSVINKPEEKGTACDFEYNKINIGGKKATLGLPPFIQSLFLFNFKYEFTCFGDYTHFYITTLEPIDSVLWDFGDGTTSTDFDTTHQYSAPGTYTVTLTKTIDGEASDPLSKDVIIREKPEILDSTYELSQCDSYDNNQNDGLATFNLNSAIDDLTLHKQDDYLVYFYLNETDAENDIYNQHPLPTTYTNTTPDQIVFAKIMYKDSDCYSLGKLKLTAVVSSLLETDDLVGCETNDNMGEFDLDKKTTDIKTSLSLPSTVEISYYETKTDAINETNPLNSDYISSEKTIYFKASNKGVCYGSGTFDLKINYFPLVPFDDTLNICENDFPVTINAPIPFNQKDNYTYYWSNGSSTYSITLPTQETVSVTITDKLYNCEKLVTFDVKKVSPPIVTNVDINIDDSIIIINTNLNNDNLYALDNPFSEFQSENVFTNVSPGTHTIYLKNKFNCGVTSKLIFVLGFPKFFTPNNDGINDVWEIKGLNFSDFTYSNINIFNRYGKHLVSIDPHLNWDGFYNGKRLDSDDYWFSIDVTDSNNITKTYKGHFSLLRK